MSSNGTWEEVDSVRISDTEVLYHTKWTGGTTGGNHIDERCVGIEYTHPEEGWSTGRKECFFWGDTGPERAQKDFEKRKEALTDS